MTLLLKQRRVGQPHDTSRLDRSHPLVRGLYRYFVLGGGRTIPELVFGRSGAFDSVTNAHGKAGGVMAPALTVANSDFATLPLVMGLGNTFSCSAWVYPTDLSGRCTIWGCTDEIGPFMLEVGSSNGTVNTALALRSGNACTYSLDNMVVANQWNHIVYLRKYAGSVVDEMYVNGVAGTNPSYVPALDYADPVTATVSEIGRRAPGNQTMAGNIGDIAFWTRVLSPVEIQELYRNRWVLHGRGAA